MVFFRVINNINIKITDGTLIKYRRYKAPILKDNETVYITTYEDFMDLRSIFARVDKNKYQAKRMKDDICTQISGVPVELGISFSKEMDIRDKYNDISFMEIRKKDLTSQLKSFHKDSISVALIGALGNSISDMIASMTALRIFYNKLREIYKNVNLDIFIRCSNNSYFNRDRDIYKTQEYINGVFPLSVDLKTFCKYDYFVDNSVDISKILDINIVDAWLFKFGIDYEKISDLEKFSTIDISNFTLTKDLNTKLLEAKKRGKLLLYHPYSASITKSIPQGFAVEILKGLLKSLDNYIIVSTLKIDPKIKDDNFLDLSGYSKTIEDFIYIVSFVDKIITAHTSALHISDAFMIPTICITTKKNYETLLKYYKNVKPIYVEDSSKNLSKFIYDNDILTINKFENWKKLKAKKIIEVLESF